MEKSIDFFMFSDSKYNFSCLKKLKALRGDRILSQ